MAVADDEFALDADGAFILQADGTFGLGPECCCCDEPTGNQPDFLFRSPMSGSGQAGIWRLTCTAGSLVRATKNSALIACEDDTEITIEAVGYPDDPEAGPADYYPSYVPVVSAARTLSQVRSWDTGGPHLLYKSSTVTITLAKGESLSLAQDPDVDYLWYRYLVSFPPGASSGEIVTMPTPIAGMPEDWTGTATTSWAETRDECVPLTGELMDVGGYYPEYLDAATELSGGAWGIAWIRLYKTNAANEPVEYESRGYEGADDATDDRFVLWNNNRLDNLHQTPGWRLLDSSDSSDIDFGQTHPWIGYDGNTVAAIGLLPSAVVANVNYDYDGPSCPTADTLLAALARSFAADGEPSYSGSGLTLSINGSRSARWRLVDADNSLEPAAAPVVIERAPYEVNAGWPPTTSTRMQYNWFAGNENCGGAGFNSWVE